jgi:glyoxylase-like metal-dependent hydrolase (beta-lactamase superfamily II)
MLDALGWTGRDLFARERSGQVVQEVPWGRLERVAEGVWAMISTPLENRRTLCNGGIVAGSDGVVLVEAFGSPEGATWMAEQARALTGRWPDHVVVTHYHGDHVSGLPGAFAVEETPRAHGTPHTVERASEQARAGDSTALLEALGRVALLPPETETRLDLGGRTLRIVPRSGHTGSDVTVELDEPSVVFCGDLVWHRFFPNYVDARPSELTRAVAALARDRSTAYVPGHGPLADPADLELYRRLLDEVEAHARAAHREGADAEEAAATFQLPEPLADWFLFSESYPARALGAWLDELEGSAP